MYEWNAIRDRKDVRVEKYKEEVAEIRRKREEQ